MTIKKVRNYRDEIITLLAAQNLPVSDLPESMDNFFVATEGDLLIGVIGLEIYEQYGLLRSLAVARDHRSKGIASQLIAQLETAAEFEGLKEIYLLTETAAAYFSRRGFRYTKRANVPAVLLGSSEFSEVCPVSAIVMKKGIKH
jgi:amino-acid N-acetyltransferase